MNQGKPLSDLYKLYIKGQLSRKNLEGGIYQYLLVHFDKYRLFRGDREKWNEFLSWLYPRISRAVDHYREVGSSLDAYFSALIRGASKEYLRREANHYLTEYVCWQAKAEEMKLHENEVTYDDGACHNPVFVNLKPRQILILLLKFYFYANDELIEQVAKTTGKEPDELKEMINELRRMRSGQELEILDLRDRLQSQYYRCLTYQKRMKSAFPGTESYTIMNDRFARAKQRFLNMKKRLEGMRKCASNRMIAEVMKIPKGTVDSGLSAIKNYLDTPGAKE